MLKIVSIFDSIDGEANAFYGAGQLSTFIRFAGCNIRCSYCDTEYALEYSSGENISVEEIVNQIHYPHITITGGEPLIQSASLIRLLQMVALKLPNTTTSIETNGTIIPSDSLCSFSDDFIRFVCDCKLPSSGHYNLEIFKKVFACLGDEDIIKFVVADEKDWKTALEVRKNCWEEWNTIRRVYSPIHGKLSPKTLIEWMQRDDPDSQISLQLHKIIWPETVGTSIEK